MAQTEIELCPVKDCPRYIEPPYLAAMVKKTNCEIGWLPTKCEHAKFKARMLELDKGEEEEIKG